MNEEPKEVTGPGGATVMAYSSSQIAVMFSVSVDTVRRWFREGKLAAFKGANGRHYVKQEDAWAWANEKWGEG